MKHIRIISPSGVIDPKYIDGAAARLRSWGYQVSEGKFARNQYGRFAGTDAERLQDLVDALQDPEVDYILCSRGGYGLQRIIDKVHNAQCTMHNAECRMQNAQCTMHNGAKIIGFSDVTELHQWSLLQGQPSLHGLMCKHLSELSEDSEPIQYWRQAIEDKTLDYTTPAHPLNREGEIQGTLIGGNLSVLYGLQATPYSVHNAQCTMHNVECRMQNAQCTMHNVECRMQNAQCTMHNVILFIEDIAERHYHIDRMMQNLRMSGVLAQIKGLVVGQFSDCEDDEKMGCTVYETIRQAVEEYDYPVLFNFPAGHVERNLPLWLGAPTGLKVTSQGGKLINNLRM